MINDFQDSLEIFGVRMDSEEVSCAGFGLQLLEKYQLMERKLVSLLRWSSRTDGQFTDSMLGLSLQSEDFRKSMEWICPYGLCYPLDPLEG
jgi:hypothetical protein